MLIYQKNCGNPKLANTPRRLTLGGDLPASILSLQASPCLERENKKIKKYLLEVHIST